jgi:hypothetical protein
MSNPFAVARKYLEKTDQPEALEVRESRKVNADFRKDHQGQAEAPTSIEDGRITTVLIASEVLGADIWFALTDDWRPDPGDKTPVFYADELEFLKSKDAQTLRKIYETKLAFGPGSRVRQ